MTQDFGMAELQILLRIISGPQLKESQSPYLEIPVIRILLLFKVPLLLDTFTFYCE